MQWRTKALYEFILSYKAAHDGVPPTTRDVIDALDFTSTSVVAYHLGLLEDANLIRRPCDGRRAIEVVGGQWMPPAVEWRS